MILGLVSELATVFQSSPTIRFYGAYCTAMNRMEQSNPFTEIFEVEGKHKQILPLLNCFGTNLMLKAEKEYNSTNPNSVLSFTCFNMGIIVAITAIFCQNNFDSDKV